MRFDIVVGPHELQICIENFTTSWSSIDDRCVAREPLGLIFGSENLPQEIIILIQIQFR